MNVLSLCGALLTATASVSSGGLRMDHPKSKMENVTYKYQTNEVNSMDDLIVGNVYHCDYFKFKNYFFTDLNLESEALNIHFLTFEELRVDLQSNNYALIDEVMNDTFNNSLQNGFFVELQNTSARLYYNSANLDTYACLLYDQYLDIYCSNCDFYLETESDLSIFKNFYYYYFNEWIADESQFVLPTASTYNEIVLSDERQGGLYNTIYGFFYELFDTDELQSYNSTIMGQSTSLTSWLAHSVSIVLMALGVLWLILVIRWIFRVFSGLIKV